MRAKRATMKGRAPPFDSFRQHIKRAQLKPGSPTSPGEDRLPLLSSEPDGVHSSPPRGAQLSTSKLADSGRRYRTSGWNSASLERIASTGHRYLPT